MSGKTEITIKVIKYKDVIVYKMHNRRVSIAKHSSYNESGVLLCFVVSLLKFKSKKEVKSFLENIRGKERQDAKNRGLNVIWEYDISMTKDVLSCLHHAEEQINDLIPLPYENDDEAEFISKAKSNPIYKNN